jgi:hypothetical protein|nr:MAG TPA: hypothetical protein [Caudoviricetes sp.]
MNRLAWIGVKIVVGVVAVKLVLPYVCDAVGLYDADTISLNSLSSDELMNELHQKFMGEAGEEVDGEDEEDYTEV